MKTLFAILFLAISATALSAQEYRQDSADPYIQVAIDSGVCGNRLVMSAVLVEARGEIEVICSEDAEGFVPFFGGLSAPVVSGIAMVLAAAGGSGSPSDTQ